MTVKELRELRAQLGKQANDLVVAANASADKRMTAEQTTEWDRLHTEIDSLAGQLTRAEKQETLNRELASQMETTTTSTTENREGVEVTAAEKAEAFRAWTLGGARGITLSERQSEVCRRSGLDPRVDQIVMRRTPQNELRALTTATGSSGGYTTPTGFVPQLEVALLSVSSVRSVSTVVQTDTGNPLPFPTADDTANVGAILAENTQIAASTDPTFSQVTLNAWTYTSKPVLIPIQLIQDTGVNLESFISSRLGIRIGRAQNAHYTTGTNSSQPNGIVTAAAAGKTAASATAITFPELVDLEHSVDPIYRSGAQYMFKDSTLQALKKLVDGNSRPLWQAGISATFANGAPDTISGYRYVINQDMPAMTTGLKSVLFGDLSKYLVRECTDIVLIRLNERYADFHQVAFLAYMRSDGDLLDAGTHPVKYLIQA